MKSRYLTLIRLAITIFALSILLQGIWKGYALAQEDIADKTLIVLGDSNLLLLTDFLEITFDRVQDRVVRILVLPIATASNPIKISDAERSENLNAAGNQRRQLERICHDNLPPNWDCEVSLAPILTRQDASAASFLNNFTDDLSAILILEGDQKVAIQVISGTPVEEALFGAYQEGILIAGMGNAANIQSLAMLAGLNPEYNNANALNFNAVDLWADAQNNGLLFGLDNAIIDTHFLIESRLGRLLNAITLPDAPHIGFGIDASAGLALTEGESQYHILGTKTITILDADTYQSAIGVEYQGPDNVLSLRNVLLHIFVPTETSNIINLSGLGESYALPFFIERSFESLSVPPGAGTLILANSLSGENDPILDRFGDLAGARTGNIVIVSQNLGSNGVSSQFAQLIHERWEITPISLALTDPNVLEQELSSGVSGMIILSDDAPLGYDELISSGIFASLQKVWLQGAPLLVEGPMAELLMQYMIQLEPPSQSGLTSFKKTDPLLGYGQTIKSGLGWLNFNLVTQLEKQSRWGHLLSLTYHHPDLLTIGLHKDTSIEISSDGTKALGENAIVVFDARQARLGPDADENYLILNGLLDVFGPGESLSPRMIEINSQITTAPTPAIPTPTPITTLVIKLVTPTPTEVGPEPTKTPKPPRPTATPLTIPPSANPGTNNLMVLLGSMILVTILIGIWINRRRVF